MQIGRISRNWRASHATHPSQSAGEIHRASQTEDGSEQHVFALVEVAALLPGIPRVVPFPSVAGERSCPLFLHKLQEEKESPDQQQARHAISLYYELLQPKTHASLVRSPLGRITTGNSHAVTAPPADAALRQISDAIEADSATQVPAEPPRSLLSLPRRVPLTPGGSWQAEYARLGDVSSCQGWPEHDELAFMAS
jgi:hypothetical protein